MTQPAAYSNAAIVTAMMDRDIVIRPFHEDNLGTSSYDVRLGAHYWVENPPDPSRRGAIYNIYDEDAMRRVWRQSLEAEPFSRYVHQVPEDERGGISPDDLVILVSPGETILAHTEEFIGGRDHITTMMKARSSFGRNFIEVCKCAGWGDVGFVNRWTMEITNNSRYYPIPLVVGRRIAQIVFFETSSLIETGRDYAASGKYQMNGDIEDVMRRWTPEAMLPRLHLDREARR